MDISIYFSPVFLNEEFKKKQYGELINVYTESEGFPNLEDVDIAIIGVEESRGAIDNQECGTAPHFVRSQLYNLYEGDYNTKIADLGNIKKGNTKNDTYFALSDSISELIKNNITPIIIGGGQDLTYANYLAYKKLEQMINIVIIDKKIDLNIDNKEDVDSNSYINYIIEDNDNCLFNCSNIGYQTYLVNPDKLNLVRKLYFDNYRLGIIRNDISETEPIIRDSDMVSFDISSIRSSDAPGNKESEPNGLYAEEACKLSWYAGLSDKLSSIGFYEFSPINDNKNQTAKLVAQMVWYFIEGYYNRNNDFPKENSSDYIKYNVELLDNKYNIVFYKSKKTNRWWMEIPHQPNKKINNPKFMMIPCSYKDYETACNNELPDRWWQTYQKIY